MVDNLTIMVQLRLKARPTWIENYRQMADDRLTRLGAFRGRTKGTMTNEAHAAPLLTVTTPGPREIRVERVFNAPRERVWRAFTDPDWLAQWWGRGNKLVIERFEFQRGGRWRFVEHSPQSVHGFEGRYREIAPPDRIVQRFEWDGMPAAVD